MEIFMTTGEKIRKIRKMSGMTQEELANKLSVTRQTISRYESGASVIDLDTAATLCRLFQISLDEFADNAQEEKKAVKNDEKISLKDMMNASRRIQQNTVVLLGGLFFIMIGVLAELFVLAIQSTTLSIEYMMYRYIATGEYAYAPVDYEKLMIPGFVLAGIGLILCGVCAFRKIKERQHEKNI
jgi:transcriptional regulator with XRE-family HTH domain